MPEHLLDGPEVGSAFEQVGGKGVAECVGADVFGDSGEFAEAFDYDENHLSGEPPSAPVEEDGVCGFGFCDDVGPDLCEVVVNQQ